MVQYTQPLQNTLEHLASEVHRRLRKESRMVVAVVIQATSVSKYRNTLHNRRGVTNALSHLGTVAHYHFVE